MCNENEELHSLLLNCCIKAWWVHLVKSAIKCAKKGGEGNLRKYIRFQNSRIILCISQNAMVVSYIIFIPRINYKYICTCTHLPSVLVLGDFQSSSSHQRSNNDLILIWLKQLKRINYHFILHIYLTVLLYAYSYLPLFSFILPSACLTQENPILK